MSSPSSGLTTCSYCKREWDGNAQCNCYQGMYMSAEDEVKGEVKEEVEEEVKEELLKIEHLEKIGIVYKLILDKCSSSSELHVVLEYLEELLDDPFS